MRRRRRQKGQNAGWLGGTVVCAALCLAAATVGQWAPAVTARAQQVVLGGTAARAAWAQFTQSLADGEPVVAAFSTLYDRITDGEQDD